MTGVLATGFAQEERRREYLRVWEQVARVPLFASLGVVTLSEIVGKLRTRYYPSRITVVRRGDAGDSMFFISSGEVEVRLPNGGSVQLGEGAFFGEMALLERQPRTATVATTRPTTLLVLYASDFYEIASHIPKLAEAVENEAKRRREENLERQAAGQAMTRPRYRGHWPGPPLGLYRASSRGLASAGRPARKAADVVHHARHPGWRLRQAPVAAVTREHAQAVRAAARHAVDLPADPAARRRPRPVCTARDRHQRCLPLHGRAAGQGHRHRDRHPGRAVAARFGPAMAAAAAYTRNQGAKAVLALASDHLVIGVEEFLAGCREGLLAVERGGIVTFGIPPTEPKTDYGYIRPGSEQIGTVQKVAAFVEKPNAQTALRYIAEGLLWNSGNFLFPPELLLSEMARFEPAMAAAAEEAVAKARKSGSTVFLDAEAFAKAPAKSIDYAVMERTDKCWVVPAKFRWSDLGTWDALLDVGEADSAGNVTEGPVEIDHVRNSYVRSDGPLTAVIGVEEVVVVAMNDAVLVGHRDNLPRLKDVVQRMSDGKHRAATEHAVMHRPWGSYQDIDRGERFRAKRLTVNPKGKLSLQSHKRRAEHWVVVKGIAEVTLDGKIMTLHENESIYIPMGGIHRLANPGSEPLEVVEVQTGDYLEEDDIIRYEDIYARV